MIATELVLCPPVGRSDIDALIVRFVGLHSERDPNESSVGLRSRCITLACQIDIDCSVTEGMSAKDSQQLSRTGRFLRELQRSPAPIDSDLRLRIPQFQPAEFGDGNSL